MDQLDEEIVNLVDAGTIKYTALAKRLGIPISTVHMRMKKLEDAGVIRYYRGEIDWRKTGLNLSAYILISIDVDTLKRIKKTQEKLLKELLAVPFVREGCIVTGEDDLLIKVVAKDTTDLRDIILGNLGQIEGISKSKTMIVLD